MGEVTGIEWTDHTFNPWIGCEKISPGCKHCYAKTMDDRFLNGAASHWGPGAPRRVMSENYWKEPYRWAKKAKAEGLRHKVFTASQADIFDSAAPAEERRKLWQVIGDTFDHLDWQIVTKRPENILGALYDDKVNEGFLELTRCWLIVSTEDQERANQRIPAMFDVPAAVYGVSAEPLLGLLDLTEILHEGEYFNALRHGLGWVICGGESGTEARPMHPSWAARLRDDCSIYHVPFFFKQWGEWRPRELHDSDMLQPRIRLTDLGGDGSSLMASGEYHVWMQRVGKKAAGALLDGISYRQFPEAHGKR